MNHSDHFAIKMWRPAIAWSYVVINLCDFAINPIVFNVLQFMDTGQKIEPWTSITLQGSGLFHLSMGAIIGVATHGRTKEKLATKTLLPEQE